MPNAWDVAMPKSGWSSSSSDTGSVIPTFHSRTALWIIRIAVLIPAVLSLGGLVFELGDCTIGLTHRGDCAHIPWAVGDLALLALLAGYLFGLYLSPVLIVVGLLQEFLTRRRDRRNKET